MTQELDHVWTRICSDLRRTVTDSTFAIWIDPLRPVALDGDVLTVSAPDDLRTWVTQRYSPLLLRAARAHLGEGASLTIVAPGERVARATRPSTSAGATATAPADHATANERLTFGHFVIGDSNRLAHAAALAVAEAPGQAYNPLYICGPPGLGKTHLLNAIGDYVRRFGGGLTVRATTVEAFTNAFVTALQHRSTEAFKARFRHVDVLLIDDVQFLEQKAKTEEEFFHTFNALYDMGSQLVLTSDRPPRDLDALEDRLRERFEAGLVCQVTAPDDGTRLAILRQRAAFDGIDVPDDALGAIAGRITDNVRGLEGALIRVVAFASLNGRPVTPELATEVLDGLYPSGRISARRTVEDVQAAACDAFAITRDELLSAGRSARVAWPRQVAMYLARELTDQTLPAIGAAFGGRDHTTVLYACRRTADRIASDHDDYEAVRRLTERLRGAG